MANAIIDIISDIVTMSLGKLWCEAQGPTSTLQHVRVPLSDGYRSHVSLTCCLPSDGGFLLVPCCG